MEPEPPDVSPRSIQLSPPATLSGIGADLKIHAGVPMSAPMTSGLARLLVTALLSRGFHMMLLWRIGAAMRKIKLAPLAIIFEKLIYHLYHCDISTAAQIGPGMWVAHPLGIVINSRARLGREVHVRQGVEIVQVWPQDAGRSGLVGDRVQLSSGAILLRGAIVGEDSIVAARALISKPVPPRHLAVGIPAKARPLRPEQFIHESTPDKPEGAPASIHVLPPINDFQPRA